MPELVELRNISSQIEAIIQAASVHVAISHWCLDELHLIVKSRVPIIPVFYKVKPHPVPKLADLVDLFIKAWDRLLLSLKVIGALL